jgi:hypothetical protein
MTRRPLVLTTGAVLALVAALPAHAATRGSGCLTLTDPQGDAHAPSAALYQPPATPGVDIESVKVASDSRTLTMAMKVGDIRLQPPSSIRTRMDFEFVLRNRAFSVFYTYSPVPSPVEEPVITRKGIEVFGELVSKNVAVSVVDNTVTISVSYAELNRLSDDTVVGQRLLTIQAGTTTYYFPDLGVHFNPYQTYDSVQAPRGVAPVLGAACR